MSDLLARKIHAKQSNARKEGLRFLLTRAEVEQLLQDAGITVEQWNHKEYHLSRDNDTGDYVTGRCKFIPAADNYAARKVSEKAREQGRKLAAHVKTIIPREERVLMIAVARLEHKLKKMGQ